MMIRNSRLRRVALAVVAILVATILVGYARPLKVVILAGQSNMQEPARWHTLAGLADSPETKPLYGKLVDENGKVRIHKDVRVAKEISGRDKDGNPFTSISSSPLPRGFGGLVLGTDKAGGSYGPELGFGVTLHENRSQ